MQGFYLFSAHQTLQNLLVRPEAPGRAFGKLRLQGRISGPYLETERYDVRRTIAIEESGATIYVGTSDQIFIFRMTAHSVSLSMYY